MTEVFEGGPKESYARKLQNLHHESPVPKPGKGKLGEIFDYEQRLVVSPEDPLADDIIEIYDSPDGYHQRVRVVYVGPSPCG